MRLNDIQHTVDLTLEELVDELVAARATLAAQQQAVWYLDRAVIEGMQSRGATSRTARSTERNRSTIT